MKKKIGAKTKKGKWSWKQKCDCHFTKTKYHPVIECDEDGYDHHIDKHYQSRNGFFLVQILFDDNDHHHITSTEKRDSRIQDPGPFCSQN